MSAKKKDADVFHSGTQIAHFWKTNLSCSQPLKHLVCQH